jgi:hypothetical protein
MKNLFIVLFSVLITGCAATGPGYLQTTSESSIPANRAELIFYRPSGFILSARSPSIEISGQSSCDLPQGGFFKKNVQSGNINISTSLWDIPGTSRLNFQATAGERYAIRVSPDTGKVMSGALFGYAGLIIAEATSSRGGPFQMDLMRVESATTELSKTKMVSCP